MCVVNSKVFFLLHPMSFMLGVYFTEGDQSADYLNNVIKNNYFGRIGK